MPKNMDELRLLVKNRLTEMTQSVFASIVGRLSILDALSVASLLWFGITLLERQERCKRKRTSRSVARTVVSKQEVDEFIRCKRKRTSLSVAKFFFFCGLLT